MKILLTILLCSISSFGYSQIFYMREDTQTNNEILEGINVYRDSLGLSHLKRTAKLDSSAKHHAIYLAHALGKWAEFKHEEYCDVQDFDEKMTIQDRGAKAEIQFYEETTINEKRFKGKSPEQIIENERKRLKLFFNDISFSHSTLTGYRGSEGHYDIIKMNHKKNSYGSCNYFIIYRNNYKNETTLVSINVVDFE